MGRKAGERKSKNITWSWSIWSGYINHESVVRIFAGFVTAIDSIATRIYFSTLFVINAMERVS